MRAWGIPLIVMLLGAAPVLAQSALEQFLNLPRAAPPPASADTPAAPPPTPPPQASQTPPSPPQALPSRAAAPVRVGAPIAVVVPPRPAVREGFVVPKGSRVALPLIEGFIESAASIGLVNESADAIVTVADLPIAPADQIETIVSRAVRLQPGVRIEKTETVARTDGTSAPLVAARRVAGGNIYTLMAIGIALPEALAIVTLSVRRDGPISDEAARDILLQIEPALENEVTTPDQLLMFAANPQPPLRYVNVVPPTGALYTIGSVKRPGPPTQPLFAIGFSRQPPPPDSVSAADFARLVMLQIASLDKIALRSVREARLAGYPASEAVADAVDRTDGGPRRVIQWLAIVPDGALVAYGIARPQDSESAFAAFRAAAAAVALKPAATPVAP